MKNLKIVKPEIPKCILCEADGVHLVTYETANPDSFITTERAGYLCTDCFKNTRRS